MQTNLRADAQSLGCCRSLRALNTCAVVCSFSHACDKKVQQPQPQQRQQWHHTCWPVFLAVAPLLHTMIRSTQIDFSVNFCYRHLPPRYQVDACCAVLSCAVLGQTLSLSCLLADVQLDSTIRTPSGWFCSRLHMLYLTPLLTAVEVPLVVQC